VTVFGFEGGGFDGWGLDGWEDCVFDDWGAGARAHPIETTIRADSIKESNPEAMQVWRMNSPLRFIRKVCSVIPLASNTFHGRAVTGGDAPAHLY
jgi:hypothetical protein